MPAENFDDLVETIKQLETYTDSNGNNIFSVSIKRLKQCLEENKPNYKPRKLIK